MGTKESINLLLQQRTPSCLVKLAEVKRQKIEKAAMKESIDLCKEALTLDIKYSEAWGMFALTIVGIGVSYLKLYFHVSRDTGDLMKSLAAYNKPEGCLNPDLYFNRATIHQYREHYHLAILDYQRASELDAHLAPTCEYNVRSLQQFVNNLEQMLCQVVRLYNARGSHGITLNSTNQCRIPFLL
jgi:tetratricopeptide (TPR) repeat protein